MAKPKRNFVNDSGWGSIDLVWVTTVICEFCNLNGIEWRFTDNYRVVISSEANIDLKVDVVGEE